MSERWKPKIGDIYYFIYSDGTVADSTWQNDPTDTRLFERGNCFRTEAKAEAAAEKVKALMLSLHEPPTDSSQPVTDCNQLPKLTTEVFKHPDCPEWAKYAAVDAACLAHWYQYPPIADERVGAWTYSNKRQVIGQYFNRSDWQNSLVERPTKTRPKLTAEVFDRKDCPEWAKYAVVDCDGYAWWYKDVPTRSAGGKWFCDDTYWKGTHGIWDASDWQNSLIERPAKALPDWCMVDAMGWHKRCGYFKVTNIDNVSRSVDIQQVEDNSKGYLSFNTVCNEVTQARLRPYNIHEMEALVGKPIEAPNGDVYLCKTYYRPTDTYEAAVDVNFWVSAAVLLRDGYKLNNKPCGKLEHLNEKGEWVE